MFGSTSNFIMLMLVPENPLHTFVTGEHDIPVDITTVPAQVITQDPWHNKPLFYMYQLTPAAELKVVSANVANAINERQ